MRHLFIPPYTFYQGLFAQKVLQKQNVYMSPEWQVIFMEHLSTDIWMR